MVYRSIMITRRTALALPALLFVPPTAEAQQIEPDDRDCTALYRIGLTYGGPDTLLGCLSRIHDDFQLEIPREIDKAGTLAPLDSKHFRWVEQIQAVLQEAGHTLPVEYQQMVERLKVVERTGRPVKYTIVPSKVTHGRTGAVMWLSDYKIEMVAPVYRTLPTQKAADGWAVELPQGVEVEIKISTPYKSSLHNERSYMILRYSRQGEASAMCCTHTDPKDETKLALMKFPAT